MVDNKVGIPNINLCSNVNSSNDGFTREFSFLSKSISKSEINSAIKHGDHERYRKLIKGHDATFIQSPEHSLSPLHHAVTCNNKRADEVKKTISAVLQSGIDINHLDEKGNTPLMYLLNEAKERGKKLKDDCISKVEFLMKRGASLHADLYQIIPKEALNKIYEAKQKFQEEAKAKLSKYIEDSDIEDVSIYGNRARIQLKGDKNEFKISEFLQSDFCQKNGISGFSTLHSNGKSGIHGVVSSEGIRHYAVTDGSYEMTLKWYVEGKKCEVVIKIDSDGYVKLVKGNGVTEEQLKANKDVKIGDLFLAEALAEGRWKEKEVQRGVRSETLRSSDNSVAEEIVRKDSAPLTPERVESQPVTSTPMHGAQKLDCNLSPIPYAGNYPPLSPEGKTFFERVFSEQNSEPLAHSRTSVKKVAPPPPEKVADNPQADPNRSEGESRHAEQSWNEQEESVLLNQRQTAVKLPVAINNGGDTSKDSSALAEEKRAEVDRTQAKILTQKISLQELVQAGKAAQQHAPQLSVPKVIADDHPQNDSSQLITSRFSFNNVVDNPEPSPRVLKQCEQRKAVREENLEGVYNLQSLFADQNVKSESAEHTAGSQPSTEKEELGLNNLDYPTPTTDYDQSRTHPKQLHAGQGALTPIKEFLSKLDENKKFPLNPIDPSKIGNDRAEDKPELLKIFDQKNLGLKQINPNKIGNNRIEDESELLKKFEQGLKPVNPDYISEQTKKRLSEDGLLKDTQTDAKTVDHSTSSGQSSTTLPSNNGSDSGYASLTHTNQGKRQVNPEQPRKNVGQNELTLFEELKNRLSQPTLGLKQINLNRNGNNDSGYSTPTTDRGQSRTHSKQLNVVQGDDLTQLEEFLSQLDENKKFPLNPVNSNNTGNDKGEDKSAFLEQLNQGLKPVDSSSMSEQTRKRLLEDGLLNDTQTDAKTVDHSTPTHTNQGKLQVNPEQPRKNLKNVGQNELTLLEELKNRLSKPTLGLNPGNQNMIGNDRVEDEPELLKKLNQGLKPVDSSSMSEQTRKRLLEDGLLKDTQTDVKTVESDSIPTTSKQPAESTTSRVEQDFENIELENTIKLQKNPCRSPQEPEAEALNYEKTRKALEKLKRRHEVNFDQPDKQKLEWDNNPAQKVMSELEEVFKRRNENKESISVPQITEKNILTVNSHNPFLEQISKDIEGGKLKKGTLKNWAERVKEQQKTRDAEISRG